MSDHHSKKRMKTLFSFYKKDVDNQAPTSETSMPYSDSPNSLPLVDRLNRLVLTLPVSTATTERAFSAMKIIKTRLRNKMEDGYLSGCMMLHIEKEYVDDIDSETVIDHFESIGDRRAQFR